MATETQEAEQAIDNARTALTDLMSSEHASSEILAAQGHMDAALRALKQRDTRLEEEAERIRIEAEAIQNGTYDTFDEDPRDEVLES